MSRMYPDNWYISSNYIHGLFVNIRDMFNGRKILDRHGAEILLQKVDKLLEEHSIEVEEQKNGGQFTRIG